MSDKDSALPLSHVNEKGSTKVIILQGGGDRMILVDFASSGDVVLG